MIGIFVSLILLVLAILIYRKDLAIKKFGWLFVFRILVVVCLSFILIGNIINFSLVKSAKTPLLLLVDISPSMKDKLESVKEFITNFKQYAKHKTQYQSFADSIIGAVDLERIEFLGEKTDIAKTLTMAEKKEPGAVVMLSDGQHNTMSDPYLVATQVPFPVYAMGFGKTVEHDVAISRLNAPKRIFLEDTANITVRIMSQGLDNKKAKVSLVQGNTELKSQNVILTDVRAEQELNFWVVPDEIGKMIYKVKVSGFEEEDNYSNNEKEFGINVLKSKLKIIVLTNSPSLNMRFMVSALAKEKVDVLPVIAFQGSRLQTTTEHGMKDIVFSPTCDVMILDNFDANRLADNINNQISNFVREGGGLLFFFGEKTRLNPMLSDLLPFNHNSRIIRKETFAKLNEQGVTVPIFFDAGENLLDNTPPILGLAEVKEFKKEAWVWAVAEPSAMPLIGFWKFGKGKVIEITGFPFWRFGFYGRDLAATQQKFHKLLIQFCRFLALKDFEMFSLATDQLIYNAGEAINFTFHAYQEDGRPWQGLNVNLFISKKHNPVPMVEVSSGIYETAVEALLAQDYTVTAVARLDTLKVGEAKTDFRVSETNIEMLETRLNSDLLKRIAELSGGEYFAAESFSAEEFDFNFARYRKTFRFDPRRLPYLYVILAGLFLIELYIRKRRGLM
ncbi:MAG: hypothetical protein ACETVX_00650 [bacterium]